MRLPEPAEQISRQIVHQQPVEVVSFQSPIPELRQLGERNLSERFAQGRCCPPVGSEFESHPLGRAEERAHGPVPPVRVMPGHAPVKELHQWLQSVRTVFSCPEVLTADAEAGRGPGSGDRGRRGPSSARSTAHRSQMAGPVRNRGWYSSSSTKSSGSRFRSRSNTWDHSPPGSVHRMAAGRASPSREAPRSRTRSIRKPRGVSAREAAGRRFTSLRNRGRRPWLGRLVHAWKADGVAMRPVARRHCRPGFAVLR